MKVKFRFGVRTYSGTVDEMIYGSYRKDHLCLGREYIYPTITANNHLKGAMLKNLASVFHAASLNYLDDLKEYAKRNGQENIPYTQFIPTVFSLFLKLMYGWYKSDPTHVDLATVTVADIVTGDADVRTIARAAAAEFLPSISEYSDLTADIQ